MCVCVCVCVYVCIYICVCVCVCMHICRHAPLGGGGRPGMFTCAGLEGRGAWVNPGLVRVV